MAVQEQRTCTKWTQDNHVDVALILFHHTETLLGCLDKAGVVTFAPPVTGGADDGTFARFPRYVAAGTLSLSRLGPILVASLAEQGFFETEPAEQVKIGLVVEDYPAAVRAADEALKPALAQRGLEVAEEGRVRPIYGARETSEALAQAPNLVLRFQSEGVNRVLLLEHGNGAMAFTFMVTARNQSYNPRYGLYTSNAPSSLTENGLESQLADAVGVGWAPGHDIGTPNVPAAHPEAARRCDELMRAQGQPMDQTGEYWLSCDHMGIFEAAAKRGDPQVGGASILAGLGRLGIMEPATTSALDYRDGRRDGVAAVRDFAFEADCGCFQYTSEPYEP